MELLYLFIVKLYRLAISISSFFNPKAKEWIIGRENWKVKLERSVSHQKGDFIWIHASSVGEFEQGRSVLESIRKKYPRYRILLTFFSPSGYQLFKDYDQADVVSYLPLDSPSNARTFLKIVRPRIVIFVKYEFWYFYFKQLKKEFIPFFLISAKLNAQHVFFKWYGSWYKKVLHFPDWYFVQDKETHDLLDREGILQNEIAGDTRIDRVVQLVDKSQEIESIHKFKNQQPVLILGSSWKTEEDYILKFFQNLPKNWKLIIAPHEINERRVSKLISQLPVNTIRYFNPSGQDDFVESRVLILDGVGVLSKAYRYAKMAIIGGGFGDGIHNILEPAVFGVPSIFGPNYKKFNEANILIKRQGVSSYRDYSEFEVLLKMYLRDDKFLKKASDVCLDFIAENEGATQRVINKIDDWIK